jgi:hypothetical protein
MGLVAEILMAFISSLSRERSLSIDRTDPCPTLQPLGRDFSLSAEYSEIRRAIIEEREGVVKSM